VTDPVRGPATAGPSRRIVEAATALSLIAVGGLVMWDSLRVGAGWAGDGPQAGYFPFYVGLIMAAASLVNLYRAIADGGRVKFVEWSRFAQVIKVLIPTAIFVASIPWLGIYAPAALFIGAFMRWLGKYGWARIVAVSVGVPVVMFLMFEIWFMVPLPKGPVETMLGY
jgi:putative tricarboxylic transport membrane protein